jgi:hypothetical protein
MSSRARWKQVTAWFVASRLVLFALGVVGVGTFVDLHTGKTTENTAALNPEFVWHKWDSVWYERVAEHGYGYELDTARGQALAGFFPLYPMTVRAVRQMVPGASFFPVGAILSNLFAVAALLLIVYGLVEGADQAGRVLAIIATSAGSFYLSIPYPESLFLLLVVAVLIATKKRQYELAGLLAGLSATTRVQGLALVAVPAIACWLDQSQPIRARLLRTGASIALFGLPFVVYMAHLADVTGSWTAFVSRQELWGNPSPYPFSALTGFIHFPRRLSNWLHGGFWLLYVWLLIRYRRKLPLGEALFCAGVFLISTQQEAFHGTYRYTVPLIPLTLALANDRQDVRYALIAINLVFGALMLLAFVTNNRLAV